jgi:hypothetical protein
MKFHEAAADTVYHVFIKVDLNSWHCLICHLHKGIFGQAHIPPVLDWLPPHSSPTIIFLFPKLLRKLKLRNLWDLHILHKDL